MKSVLSLMAAVALTGILPQSAEAGLFGCFNKHNSCDPCCAAPEPCCAPAPVTCCAPAPVYHHAPAPAACCGHHVGCGAPDPCCDPCARPRKGLFSGLFKCFRKHDRCNDCCAPEPVSCCAPAPVYHHVPSNCCGAAPSCCGH